MDLQQQLDLWARRMRWVRVGEFAVFASAGGALVAAATAWRMGGRSGSASVWPTWGLLVVAGALIGALLAWRRGADCVRAARSVDRRYGLHDRLATAAEALGRRDRSPMALCCCRQAEAVAVGLGRVRFPPQRRGLMILSAGVLLATAAVMVAIGRPAVDPEVREVLRQTDGMSAAGRARLAEEIRDGATGDDSVEPAALARAIEVRDEEQLAKIVAELQRRGLTLRQILPADVARQLGLTREHPEPTVAGESPSAGRPSKGEPDADGQHNVAVVTPASSAGDPGTASSTALSAPLSADSWSAAKARAASSPRRESVPSAYRVWVEAFMGKD